MTLSKGRRSHWKGGHLTSAACNAPCCRFAAAVSNSRRTQTVGAQAVVDQGGDRSRLLQAVPRFAPHTRCPATEGCFLRPGGTPPRPPLPPSPQRALVWLCAEDGWRL